MGPIEKAIEEFRKKRRDVYKADQDQIIRDSRAAERAAKDHVGRCSLNCCKTAMMQVPPRSGYWSGTTPFTWQTTAMG